MTWMWRMPFSLVVSCVQISHYSYLILGESNGFYHSLHSTVLSFCWNLMLHSENYNVQDFVMDVTHMMAFWVFTPCDVMYLFWHCGGMSSVRLQGDSLFGVDVSVTLKKEAEHSSKTLQQAGYNKTESQGTWAVIAVQHFCTLSWVALLSLIFHEFLHPIHCFCWLY